MRNKPSNYQQASIALHKKLGGKIQVTTKAKARSAADLSLLYSPGVAGPCREIQKRPAAFGQLVSAGRTVAVISDGSAVLGLGNIGPRPAMPVMEGKCLLFKQFAGLDAIPIVLDTQDTDEIVRTVKMIAPSFAGINLEDIAAPRCFEIEQRLKAELDIPVFHDDQHGTAIVALAGLINALQVVGKDKSARVVVNGAGAAGVAIVQLLHSYGMTNLTVCDSKGMIACDRTDLNPVKQSLLKITRTKTTGDLSAALQAADVFIGVSQANLLSKDYVASMNDDPIVFALANPDPEISFDHAQQWGVKVLATGRSDYPNQINNVLVFPGIFKGAFDSGRTEITEGMKLRAATALAAMVDRPRAGKIIPGPFARGVAEVVAKAVSSKKKTP